MESSADHEIQELFKLHENNFCFECGGPSNKWASVNNGIFLCLACAGIHRGFGPEISLVRSLTTDSWSPAQLEMMRRGGNEKLKEFFERYQIPAEGPMDSKYRTKAAYYYREKLKALVEGNSYPSSPRAEEGSEFINSTNSEISSTGQEETQNRQSSPEKGKPMTEQSEEKPKQHKSGLGLKVNGPKLKNDVKQGLMTISTSMKSGAKSVATGAKSVASKLNDKMKDSHIKSDAKAFGNKVATGAKGAATKIAVTSKEIFTHGGEFVGKGAAAAKKSYTGAVGFIKKKLADKKMKNQSSEVNNENQDVNAQEKIQDNGSNIDDTNPSVSL